MSSDIQNLKNTIKPSLQAIFRDKKNPLVKKQAYEYLTSVKGEIQELFQNIKQCGPVFSNFLAVSVFKEYQAGDIISFSTLDNNSKLEFKEKNQENINSNSSIRKFSFAQRQIEKQPQEISETFRQKCQSQCESTLKSNNNIICFVLQGQVGCWSEKSKQEINKEREVINKLKEIDLLQQKAQNQIQKNFFDQKKKELERKLPTYGEGDIQALESKINQSDNVIHQALNQVAVLEIPLGDYINIFKKSVQKYMNVYKVLKTYFPTAKSQSLKSLAIQSRLNAYSNNMKIEGKELQDSVQIVKNGQVQYILSNTNSHMAQQNQPLSLFQINNEEMIGLEDLNLCSFVSKNLYKVHAQACTNPFTTTYKIPVKQIEKTIAKYDDVQLATDLKEQRFKQNKLLIQRVKELIDLNMEIKFGAQFKLIKQQKSHVASDSHTGQNLESQAGSGFQSFDCESKSLSSLSDKLDVDQQRQTFCIKVPSVNIKKVKSQEDIPGWGGLPAGVTTLRQFDENETQIQDSQKQLPLSARSTYNRKLYHEQKKQNYKILQHLLHKNRVKQQADSYKNPNEIQVPNNLFLKKSPQYSKDVKEIPSLQFIPSLSETNIPDQDLSSNCGSGSQRELGDCLQENYSKNTLLSDPQLKLIKNQNTKNTKNLSRDLYRIQKQARQHKREFNMFSSEIDKLENRQVLKKILSENVLKNQNLDLFNINEHNVFSLNSERSGRNIKFSQQQNQLNQMIKEKLLNQQFFQQQKMKEQQIMSASSQSSLNLAVPHNNKLDQFDDVEENKQFQYNFHERQRKSISSLYIPEEEKIRRRSSLTKQQQNVSFQSRSSSVFARVSKNTKAYLQNKIKQDFVRTPLPQMSLSNQTSVI